MGNITFYAFSDTECVTPLTVLPGCRDDGKEILQDGPEALFVGQEGSGAEEHKSAMLLGFAASLVSFLGVVFVI